MHARIQQSPDVLLEAVMIMEAVVAYNAENTKS